MRDEKLTAYYPSGRKLEVFGRFAKHGRLTHDPNGPYGVAIDVLESKIINGQAMSPGSVALIDPRCVVVGEKSGLLYNPRDHWNEFQPEMREWMEENPKWPN